MRVREATEEDVPALARLIRELGYDVTEAEIGERLPRLRTAGLPPLVAEEGGVIGCATWSLTQVLHRPRPVGRVSMLVVAAEARGRGVGAALVEAVADRAKAAGCGLLEVTSNIRRERAHSFYERLGFERTSYRFARDLHRPT